MTLPRSRTERFHQNEGYDRFRKRNPIRMRVIKRKQSGIAERNPAAFNRAVRGVVSAIKKFGFSSDRKNRTSRIAATKLVLIDMGFVSRESIEAILAIEKKIRVRRDWIRLYSEKDILVAYEKDIFLGVLTRDLEGKLGGKTSVPQFRKEVGRTENLINFQAGKETNQIM